VRPLFALSAAADRIALSVVCAELGIMTLAVATTLIVSCITCHGIKSVSDPNEDTVV
jgi:hypothetical protein